MADSHDSQSPVEKGDYEGLQLDHRAGDERALYLDSSRPQGFLDDDFDDHINYINEKQARSTYSGNSRSPVSPSRAGQSPMAPHAPRTIDAVFKPGGFPPEPVKDRICGIRRRTFWMVFGLTLSLVLTGAVVGGVVGGLQSQNTPEAMEYNAPNETQITPAS